MQEFHPFPIDSAVAVSGTRVTGTVLGTWYGRKQVRVNVQYLDDRGVIRTEWFDVEQLQGRG